VDFTLWTFGINIKGISISATMEKLRTELDILLEAGTLGLFMQSRDLSLFRLMYDGGDVSPEFASALAAAPSSDPHSPAWTHLLDTFGTHYTSAVGMGAACNFSVLFNMSAVARYNHSFVETEFRVAIGMLMLGLGMEWDLGYNSTRTATNHSNVLDRAFAKAINSSWSCHGGNVSLLREPPAKLNITNYARYLKWLLTIPHTPSPVPRTAELVPLYQLVRDNPAKGAAFKAATEAYLRNKTNGTHVQQKQHQYQQQHQHQKRHQH